MQEQADATTASSPSGEPVEGTAPADRPDRNAPGNPVGKPAASEEAAETGLDAVAPCSAIEVQTEETVLVEVIPGVAAVFGRVPAQMRPDLVGLDLLPQADRQLLATAVAAVGDTAALAGNVGMSLADLQGLYRFTDKSQALIASGGRLATKDGASLGTIILDKGFAQARMNPVTKLTNSQAASALGPVGALIGLQMQVHEISNLVRANIEITRRVMVTLREKEWSDLTALTETVMLTLEQARQVGAVTPSLWSNVAGKDDQLKSLRKTYMGRVNTHLKALEGADVEQRRAYLRANAAAVLFDTQGLLTSVEAWAAYQALRVGVSRHAASNDPHETRTAEVILQATRDELDTVLPATHILIGGLARELRVDAALQERNPLRDKFPARRKAKEETRRVLGTVLQGLEPLADALRAPAAVLEAPAVLCAPEGLDPGPHLAILRWFLDDDEKMRALGFAAHAGNSSQVSLLVGGAKTNVLNRAPLVGSEDSLTLVAITDRRIITAAASDFLLYAQTRDDIDLAQLRYVRPVAAQGRNGRLIEAITQEGAMRLHFGREVDAAQVEAFREVLHDSVVTATAGPEPSAPLPALDGLPID